MSKIIRTPTRAEGGITPDEKQKMDLICEKWKSIAFQTGKIDKNKITEAIKGLYRVSGLKEPRIVIAPSPYVMALAYGLAAGWWYLKKNIKAAATRAATDAATYAATCDATRAATCAATDAATRDATYAATYAATDAATRAATDAATYAATCAATDAATDAATAAATAAATDAATRAATYAATYAATEYEKLQKQNWLKDLAILFGGNNYNILLNCISKWSNVYQGGNMWSGWEAYADAMKNVIGLTGLECFKKHKFYMDCAIYGGFRVMHDEFCIISDFPEVLKVDKENRPHCEDGPSHRWRDGFEIYHLNGVRVPKELVMTPKEKLNIEFFKKEENADIRAEFIRKYGIERMISLGKVIDSFAQESDEWYKRSEYQLVDMGKVYNLNYAPHLKMKNLTTGIYHLEGVSPDCKTVDDAIKFRCGGKNINIESIK